MFDKSIFSNLLVKARGNRNNKEYAEDCEVSRTYISGYINKSIDNPPKPEILKKLAEKSENNVTYDDLMIAAGYLADDTKPDFKPVLTAKDNKDIAKDLDSIMTKLQNEEDGPIYYNGTEVDSEDAELFRGLLEVALKKIKIKNKETYTPKKYRK